MEETPLEGKSPVVTGLTTPYPDFISVCRPHPHILVTGPPRSGTHFLAFLLAERLGRQPYIEETQVSRHAGHTVGALAAWTKTPCVIQEPGMTHICHQLGNLWFVVFLRRAVADVLDSQRRGKHRTSWARAQYQAGWPQYLEEGVSIPEVMYRVWEQEQRPRFTAWVEVSYESLSADPLWVPREERPLSGLGVVAQQVRPPGS